MRGTPSLGARGRRGRWLPALLVTAAVLTACVPRTTPPPPPTQYCGATAPVTAAERQALYDGLSTVDAEFGASDIGYPVDLGGQVGLGARMLYLMGDTWVGRVAGDAMVDPYRMVHNAFLVEEGPCITPRFGGTRGARTDLLPAPAGEWRWPLSGFVDGSKLRVFVQGARYGPGLCGCVALGVDIATFSLPDLAFEGVVASPRPEVLPTFGIGVVTSGGYHYVYGRDFQLSSVARVAVGADVTDGASWRYWNGGVTGTDADWGTDGTGACLPGSGGPCPMTFEMPGGVTSTTGPNASLFVQADPSGGFVASAMAADVSDPTILVWHGATAVGPWLDPQVAATPIPPANGFAYAGKVFRVASAGPAAPWMASYSTNRGDNHLHVSGYKVVFTDAGYP